MMKMMRKIRESESGSALLVALLVMGVFVAVSLILSSLIFRELRVTRELLNSGKAYYAAESGVEEALYYLNTELPGWSASDKERDVSEDSKVVYSVKNSCSSYPCFDEDDYVEGALDAADTAIYSELYETLDLNQTVTIPLFTVDEDGNVESVEHFTVEFFGEFDPSKDLKVKSVSGWDILRWKVFGMVESTDGDTNFLTESIDDFTAIASGRNSEGEDIFANAKNPSWFGSVSCEDPTLGASTTKITCSVYTLPNSSSEAKDGRICSNVQARDYYYYSGGEVLSVKSCYPIDDYMRSHQPGALTSNGMKATGLNYLSLTNLMNPVMFDDSLPEFDTISERSERARIHFRVETYGDKVVPDFAEIKSTGLSKGTNQTLTVRIKKDSYIPVFNFSVYSTYEDE